MYKLFATILSMLYFVCLSVYATAFKLTSPAFSDHGVLPMRYTCDGANISPELHWENAPSETKTYTLILADPDAPGGVFYHWIIYNLPAGTNMLAEGVSQFPGSTKVGRDSWGKVWYGAPCPPKGSIHHYVFTLYALNTMLSLLPGATADIVFAKMSGHIVDQVNLTAKYER